MLPASSGYGKKLSFQINHFQRRSPGCEERTMSSLDQVSDDVSPRNDQFGPPDLAGGPLGGPPSPVSDSGVVFGRNPFDTDTISDRTGSGASDGISPGAEAANDHYAISVAPGIGSASAAILAAD